MSRLFRLKPNDVVGPYEIVSPLGQGGMGEVYRAYEPSLHRPVALKVISSSISSDSEFIQRFHSEGRVLAKIIHPNVVTVYSLGNSNGVEYMAMEFVDGKSLLEVIQENGKFSVEAALPVFRQMLSGVKALHDAGIIHRDLKPGNVIQCHDGKVKIVDLGIAKLMSSDGPDLTAVGEFIGSPRYMAPEVTVGDPPGPQSDIWACGLIFYEMLTARPAYHGKSKIEILKNVRTREIAFSATEKSRLPEPVMDLILRMSCPDPSQRYTKADDVLADLIALIEGKDAPKVGAVALRSPSLGDGPRVTLKEVRNPTTSGSKSLQRSSSMKKLAAGLTLIAALGGLGWFLKGPEMAKLFRTPSSEKARVQLQYPIQGEVFWNHHHNEIQLVWGANEELGSLDIEISLDRNFSRKAYSFSNAKSPFKLDHRLDEGEYFWRVTPTDPSISNPIHDVGHFRIAYVSPPKALEPKEMEEILGSTDAHGRLETHFQWKTKPTATQYQIQVARDAKFSEVVLDEKTGESELKRRMNPGSYFWRVKITSPEFLSMDWSPGRSFKVGNQETPDAGAVANSATSTNHNVTLSSPKLIQAAREISINLNRKVQEREIASELKSKRQLPVLTWTPVDNAKSYKVEIARNRSFHSSHLVASLKSDSQSVTWDDPTPGTFYWRVLAVDAKGISSPWSTLGTLELFFPAPTHHSQPLREDSSLEVSHIQWNEVLSAPYYLLEVSSNDRFAPIIAKEKVQRNVASLKLSNPGTYYARVAVTNSLGEIISPFSRSFSFLLEQRVTLNIPKVLVPTSGTEIIASMDGSPTPIIFQWNPVPQAQLYQLQFSLDAQFKVVFHSERSTSTRFTLNKPFPPGRMYWRMRSERGSSSSAWTSIYHFELP